MKTDTIAAIATAMSESGIGIIRVSGDEAISLVDRIFCPKDRMKLADSSSHTVHYGYIVDGEQVIDEVLILLMRRPKSYTKEDVVEIDCHGGVLVMQKILSTVCRYGARPAEPGEFTKRAFLNGRIDLSQAESVIDLINSKNEFAWKSSISQLQGSVRDKIDELRKKILHETAFIESALDDPEHYSVDGYGEQLFPIVEQLQKEIQRLINNSESGRVLKEGIDTVIVGKPNVGKSSILNVLVGSDRAIVTEIAGTTRDVLKEHITLNGISLNVIDTAGIRDTEDIVEQIGVNRAKEYLEEADLVLYVVDSSRKLTEEDHRIAQLVAGKQVIILFNKSDLSSVVSMDELIEVSDHVIQISAKTGDGVEKLTDTIRDLFLHGSITFNDELVITNIRHTYELEDAARSLQLVQDSIRNGLSEDFYSIDLWNAYESLSRIIGESIDDDLADEIFSKFCMGK